MVKKKFISLAIIFSMIIGLMPTIFAADSPYFNLTAFKNTYSSLASTITEVKITDTTSYPENATNVSILDMDNTGRIKGWVQDTVLYIGSYVNEITKGYFYISDAESMFENFTNVTEIDLSGMIPTSSINVSRMFANCPKLKSVDLTKFNSVLSSDTTDVTDMFDGDTLAINTNVYRKEMGGTTLFVFDKHSSNEFTTYTGVNTGTTIVFKPFEITQSINKSTIKYEKSNSSKYDGLYEVYFSYTNGDYNENNIYFQYGENVTITYTTLESSTKITNVKLDNIDQTITNNQCVCVLENICDDHSIVVNGNIEYHLVIQEEDGPFIYNGMHELSDNIIIKTTDPDSVIESWNAGAAGISAGSIKIVTIPKIKNVPAGKTFKRYIYSENYNDSSNIYTYTIKPYFAVDKPQMTFLIGEKYQDYKTVITKIKSSDTITPPKNATNIKRLDDNGDIMAWMVDTELYIGCESSSGKYYLPESGVLLGGFENLTSIDTNKWDTSKVKYFNRAFQDCSKLETLDVSNWDTSNVIAMNKMFKGCSSLKSLDVKNWNLNNIDTSFTASASPFQGLSEIFAGCTSMKKLDIRNWNLNKSDNLTWLDKMFDGDTLALYSSVYKKEMGGKFIIIPDKYKSSEFSTYTGKNDDTTIVYKPYYIKLNDSCKEKLHLAVGTTKRISNEMPDGAVYNKYFECTEQTPPVTVIGGPPHACYFQEGTIEEIYLAVINNTDEEKEYLKNIKEITFTSTTQQKNIKFKKEDLTIVSSDDYSFTFKVPDTLSKNKNYILTPSDKETFTVEFYNEDGKTLLATKEVENGQAVELIQAPDKEGYAFDGWTQIKSSDSEKNIQLNNITGNVKYKAAYRKTRYDVKFYQEDGTTQIGNVQKIDRGNSAAVPVPSEKKGYTFAGWIQMKKNDSDPTIVPENITNDVDFKASYTPIKYEVKFYEENGTTQIGVTQNINYNSAATAPKAPDKEGYVFDKWIQIKDDETEPTISISNITNNVSYKASYTKITYKVKFYKEDGITQIGETQTIDKNHAASAPVAPDKQGYTFVTWTQIKSNENEPNIAIDNIIQDVSYKAVYKATKVSMITSTTELNSVNGVDKVNSNSEAVYIRRGKWKHETTQDVYYYVQVNDDRYLTLSKFKVTATPITGYEKISSNATKFLSVSQPIVTDTKNIDGKTYAQIKVTVSGMKKSGAIQLNAVYDGIKSNSSNAIFIIPGDTTKDGYIDAEDINKDSRYAMLDTPQGGEEHNYELEICDVTKDNIIDSQDVDALARLAMGMYNIGED